MINRVLKSVGTSAGSFFEQRRRHLGHKNHAAHVLSVLADKGEKLTAVDRRKSHEYASEVLGNAKYEHWLRVFSVVQGGFQPGWIPDDYYFDHVIPRWNGAPGQTSYLKSVSNVVLNTQILPDVLVLANGLFFTPAGVVVADAEVKDVVFAGSERVIYKADSSIQGRGICVITPGKFDLDSIKAMGNGVFQTFVHQHPTLDKFAPGNVSTLRITTIKNEAGEIEVRGSCLRLGRTASQYVKSSEQLIVPIDIQTGEMGPTAFDPNFLSHATHPDTREAFADVIYPHYDSALQAVRGLHAQLSLSRCVGWDVVVDAHDQPKLLEWNGFFNSLRSHEALQGPTMTGLGWEHLWREPALPAAYNTLF